MNKRHIIIAAMVIALAAAGVFLAQAGPFDDLGKGLNDLNKAKDTVDKYKEPVKGLYDASKPWPLPEERAAGRALAARVSAAFGGVLKDEEWSKYVNKVGRGLVPYSNRPDIKYRFAILNTDDINAYSCPGGYIFITKGLLKEMKNEDQLAGVLAHEIGHVSERQIEKAMRQEKALGALLQGGLSIAQDTGNLSGEQAQLAKQMSDLSWEILIKKGLSQQDEFEADRVGVDNMAKMGYNPMGMHQVLARLKELSAGSGGKMKIMLSTHPAPEKRMEQVMQTITSKGYNQSKPTLDKRFMDFKSKHPL